MERLGSLLLAVLAVTTTPVWKLEAGSVPMVSQVSITRPGAVLAERPDSLAVDDRPCRAHAATPTITLNATPSAWQLAD